MIRQSMLKEKGQVFLQVQDLIQKHHETLMDEINHLIEESQPKVDKIVLLKDTLENTST
jgi:hypothetical protein